MIFISITYKDSRRGVDMQITEKEWAEFSEEEICQAYFLPALRIFKEKISCE
jgi:hypothetical protein